MPKCLQHPEYSGIRLGKKAKECPGCVAYYSELRLQGMKETRSRRLAQNKLSSSESDEISKIFKTDVYKGYEHLRDPVKRWAEQRDRCKTRFKEGDIIYVVLVENGVYIPFEHPCILKHGPLDWGGPEPHWLLKRPHSIDFDVYPESRLFASLQEAMLFVLQQRT